MRALCGWHWRHHWCCHPCWHWHHCLLVWLAVVVGAVGVFCNIVIIGIGGIGSADSIVLGTVIGIILARCHHCWCHHYCCLCHHHWHWCHCWWYYWHCWWCCTLLALLVLVPSLLVLLAVFIALAPPMALLLQLASLLLLPLLLLLRLVVSLALLLVLVPSLPALAPLWLRCHHWFGVIGGIFGDFGTAAVIGFVILVSVVGATIGAVIIVGTGASFVFLTELFVPLLVLRYGHHLLVLLMLASVLLVLEPMA